MMKSSPLENYANLLCKNLENVFNLLDALAVEEAAEGEVILDSYLVESLRIHCMSIVEKLHDWKLERSEPH